MPSQHHLRFVHGSEYGAGAPYPVTCCIGMAPAGAGSYSGRYTGLRRLATSHTAPVSAATPATAAAAKMGILYFWKKLLLPDPELLLLWRCELVVSCPPSRAATKSAWASAGIVVERS